MSTQKVIDSMTPEQEARIPEYLEKYLAMGLSTEPVDKQKAEAAVAAGYKYAKLDPPTFIWAKDPFEGRVLAAQYAKGDENVTDEEVQAQAGKASYGSFEAYWLSTYAFKVEVLGATHDGLYDIIKDIITNCGLYWTFEGLVIMTPKPSVIKMVYKKLSCVDGPALAWEGGKQLYFYNGEYKNSLLEVAVDAKYEKV